MSDYPHGHANHSGWGCTNPECIKRIQVKQKTVNKMFENANVIEGEHSTVITNMQTGGWVEQKDGMLVSIEYAKTLNRAQRRKLGIKL
jgi:hypothetical protein